MFCERKNIDPSLYSKLKFKKKYPIFQNAHFYDTNRGERPNLTACSDLFILRAKNKNYHYNDRRNEITFQLYDGQKPNKLLYSVKISGLMDSLFPIQSNIFGGYRNDRYLEYYLIDLKKEKKISTIHSFQPRQKKKQFGFQGEPPNIFSSYQHFFSHDVQPATFVTGDWDLHSLIYDVETHKLLYDFEDLGKPFMKNQFYFLAAGKNCCTIDLREKYHGEQESMIGFSSKDQYRSHFLLPYQNHTLSFENEKVAFLPEGILSTKQGYPEWGTTNRYQASIYGGHYLFSPHNGLLWRFLPSKKKIEWIGVSEGSYFGGNASVIFDAHWEYWL